MTERNATPAPGAESLQDGSQQVAEVNDTGEQENGSQKGNREARYRVERNQAREELSAAQARIEALQTRELERLAAEHLAQPADLLALGEVPLTELLDDDGNVVPEAVAEAAEALIESRPGLAKNPRVAAVDQTQGMGSDGGKRLPTFADLFRQ